MSPLFAAGARSTSLRRVRAKLRVRLRVGPSPIPNPIKSPSPSPSPLEKPAQRLQRRSEPLRAAAAGYPPWRTAAGYPPRHAALGDHGVRRLHGVDGGGHVRLAPAQLGGGRALHRADLRRRRIELRLLRLLLSQAELVRAVRPRRETRRRLVHLGLGIGIGLGLG